MKKKIRWIDILVLQGAVLLFSGASILSKLASGETFLSTEYLIYFIAEIGVLGVYAIIWQQLLKRFELSVAYANKAMVLLWYMLWYLVVFKEKITIMNIVGVALAILGIYFINKKEPKQEVTAE